MKVFRRKQLFRSLLKSTREGSEELKNATRRRRKNIRKGREQNLAREDLPPSDKCEHLENAHFFIRGCFVVCNVSCHKILLFFSVDKSNIYCDDILIFISS